MASSDSEFIRKALIASFGSALGDDLLPEFVQLCKNYNKGPEDLFYTYESVIYGRQRPRIITQDILEEIKERLKRDLEKQNAKKQQQSNARNIKLPTRALKGGLIRSGGNSDVLGRLGTSASAPIKVKAEDGAFATVARPSSFAPSRVELRRLDIEPEGSKRKYRYMYEKVNERSEALDDRIEDIAQIVKQHYNIPDFGDPAAVTEDETVVIGRITMDSESLSADSAKLNEASLVLEASRMMGSGARVPLKFDPGVRIRQAVKGLKGIGLFPGAIVALKGKNGGAGWFTVQEILSLPPLNPRQPSTSSEPFSMMVACGPYTSDGDLKFGPWQTLLSKIKADSPNVVLLTGPFLDANHPSIRTGDIGTTPAEIFRTNIIEPLQSYLDSNPGSLVVMIPSVRDIISDHSVYPQAALSAELVGDPRIQLLPNPSRFSLNGIVFAVSSVDVLFHLRKEEFTKRAAEVDSIDSPGGGEAAVDPMSNLCRHVLQQRSFYPIFPVPYDLSHEVNLDVSHSEFLDFWNNEPEKAERPDVLILPSRLKQFVKVVDGVTAINPSFLTKATYASLRCSSGNPQAEIARLDG